MGVSTSEVGYIPVMPRTEDHEVLKGHVVALGKKLCFKALSSLFFFFFLKKERIEP